jgi:hypothetical protein
MENDIINPELKGYYKKNTFKLGNYTLCLLFCHKFSSLRRPFLAVEFKKESNKKRVIVSYFLELRKEDNRTKMRYCKRKQILIKQNGQNNH